MKQKFTITIADIEMNILSEGTSDEIAVTVNKVDRRIREICLRSPRISKNEAALLCALEFCSERDTAQRDLGCHGTSSDALREENAKLNDALDKLSSKVESLREKYESAAAAQKEKYESAAATQKEKYEGRIEIMKEKYEGRINSLKAKLDELKKGDGGVRQIRMDLPEEGAVNSAVNSAVGAAPDDAAPGAEAAEDKPISPKSAGAAGDADQSDPAVPADQAAAEDGKKEPRGRGKNKVGSMFDLLTFNNV